MLERPTDRAPTVDALSGFYDRFGARQDRQGWYENVALIQLGSHGRWGAAEAVLELGCGTGRFAASLLTDRLAPGASYLGLDLSATMVALARHRIAPFGSRALVAQADITRPLPVADGSVDRVLATYLFDLLTPTQTRAILAEARRVLKPKGILCLSSLSPGKGPATRLIAGLWRLVYRLDPLLVGGCRPVRLKEALARDQWVALHHAEVSAWGIGSEVILAERL